MNAPAQEQILGDIATVLADMRGGDLGESIGPETRFFADLGLASIDAVVLAERLQEHYRRPLPFAELMADLGRRDERDLVLGELVAFLRRNL